MANPIFHRKFVILENGKEVLLRFLNGGDQESYIELLQEIPDSCLIFPNRDSKDRHASNDWSDRINYRKNLPLIAVDRQAHRFIASASLHLDEDSARQVGVIRLFVSEPVRGLGLGSIMLGELVDFALDEDLEWLQAEVVAEHKGVINLYRTAGFEVKTNLKDYFSRQDGVILDAVLMVRPLPF